MRLGIPTNGARLIIVFGLQGNAYFAQGEYAKAVGAYS